MKTAIKTLIATAFTAIVLTSSAFTTFAKEGDKNPPLSIVTSGYNMINVKGNVLVYLCQGTKENVRVETEQSETKVSFKREGNKLLINATGNERAIVFLTVKDLKRIEASENAVVKSTGRFNLSLLQVFVQDKANVDVNVVAQDVYTVVKDASTLKLSGSTDHHLSEKDNISNLNVTHFAALKTDSSSPVFAIKIAGVSNSTTK